MNAYNVDWYRSMLCQFVLANCVRFGVGVVLTMVEALLPQIAISTYPQTSEKASVCGTLKNDNRGLFGSGTNSNCLCCVLECHCRSVYGRHVPSHAPLCLTKWGDLLALLALIADLWLQLPLRHSP